MTELIPHRRVHIVGAGGSGMSGLGKILAQAGHKVTGSDLKPSAALSSLALVGVDTWVGHRPQEAPRWDLVVASSAVPERDPELVAAHQRGVEVWERPRLLAEITRALPTIGVAGTHGKTTTTAMLVTALRSLGRDPSFMVGGEIVELNTNAHLGTEELFVLEADEAFGTFEDLDLQGLIVTNIEADHLDHYGTLDALEASFVRVAERVDGPVVVCTDDPGSARLIEGVSGAIGYGTDARATWRVSALSHGPGSVAMSLSRDEESVAVVVPKPGDHNALNAAGVLALIGSLGIDVRGAAEGLREFAGVRRRFEVRGRVGGVIVVDDYAHHPTELAATISAAQSGHQGRVLVAFQPHRFSRTQEHVAEFGEALSAADRVFVTDVYAAGEAPIPGVTGRIVADAASEAGADTTYVARRADLAEALAGEARAGDLVLLLGAGDITLVADEITPLLDRS